MSANAIQVGGDHYAKSEFQPWDLIVRHNINFLEGCAIKYVMRWRRKNGLQDLEKARHFLMKIEEEHENGYQPTGTVGPKVLNDFFIINEVTDFREKIAISIFSGQWNHHQLNHAALILGSLIETARDAETQKS